MSEYVSTRCCRLLVFSVFALLAGHASAARANTFTVNSTADMADVSPGDGKCETGRDVPVAIPAAKECTLRASVQESNALAGEHEIVLPAGAYLLSLPTFCSFRILETTSTQSDTSISLCMTGKMRIVGAGAGSTVIDAGGLNRVAFLDARAEVELRGVTMRKGLLHGSQAFVFGGGGGIHNRGRLTLTEVVVSENTSNFGGGGIHSVGTLTLDRSTVIGNTAVLNSGFGGGVLNGGALDCGSNACALTVNDSLITGNGSSNNGGGLGIFQGTVRVSGSTFSDNTSGNGGGILNVSGVLSLTNSTLSNNSAFRGGGLSVDRQGPVPQATLNNVTITRNKGAQTGGGIRTTADITLKNTLVAGNTNEDNNSNLASPDCETFFSAVVSEGYNLIQNTRLCTVTGNTTGNVTGQDPLLGSLTSNGGLTPTHAPVAGSPAVDAGNPKAPGSGGAACAAADQRGLLRPLGQRCDIGAFESKGGLSVSKAMPNRGGNTGSVTAIISGSGFADGAAVRLRRAGQPDIASSPVTVEDAGFAVFTSFDLSGKATGAWDIHVTNPDGSSTALPGGFTIEETKSPDLWSSIVGRSAIRVGFPTQYSILYGNRGNVDAFNVPFTISVPANVQLYVYFDIAPPPAQANQVATDWSQVHVAVYPASVRTNVPLLIPVIPAGFTGTLRIELLITPEAQQGDDFVLSAFLGDPYFNPGLDPEAIDDFVAGAREYAEQNIGVVIPPSLDPELRAYAIQQLQAAAASGRQSLVESFGTGTELYSIAQLTIDLARFGAARAPAPKVDNSAAGAPTLLAPFSTGGGTPGNCSTGTLLPGQSCGEKPPLIPTPPPPPDPNASPTPFPKPEPITPAECRTIGKHHVSVDGGFCVPDDRKECKSAPILGNVGLLSGGSADCVIIPVKSSRDPNDKAGGPGATDKRFRQSTAPLAYTIFFENLPTANAAAQIVTVTDQLDTATLDLSTLSLGPISFERYTVTPPPGESELVAALDLRPANNLIVKIDARLDRGTGILTWRFTSLDPATQEPTEDPEAGFLPPNRTTPEGEGSVTFFVSPKPGLPTGTEIRNKARIVFDVNAPIDTPEWLNTVDDAKPVSHVLPLTPARTEASFTVRWGGTDSGSGVSGYTIYVSDNGGPFTPWLVETDATEATYAGAVGHTYSFFSVASDLAGNQEANKTQAEATTVISSTTVQFSQSSHQFSEGAGRVTLTVTREGDTSAAALVDYRTEDSDTFTVGCADATGAQGSAYARCDFATAVGTLSFASGETSKTIGVPLIDDAHVEGPQSFRLLLTGASGAALGSTSFTTVTIIDNDSAGGPNPVLGPPFPFFVRQQYLDFLSREPDDAGLAAWLGVLNNCPNPFTGPEVQSGCDRVFVSGEGFFRSVEFQLKGAYVFRLYKAGFGRLPEYLEVVSDMSFVAGQTAEEVFARRAQLVTLMTQRPEFADAYGSTTNQQYVSALLSRYNLQQVATPDPLNPDTGGKVTLTSADLVGRLTAGTLTRAQVLRAVADSDEVTAAEFDNAFVGMQYYGYLRRKPEPSGYEAWLRVLRSGDTRAMVDGFLNSAEYRLRFGQP